MNPNDVLSSGASSHQVAYLEDVVSDFLSLGIQRRVLEVIMHAGNFFSHSILALVGGKSRSF